MTMMMGIARAIENVGMWDNVTHIGGVSGGSWFATQFAYSADFSRDVLGQSNLSVRDVVSKWGEQYERGMQAAVDRAVLANLGFDSGTASLTCAAGDGIRDTVDNILTELMSSLQWPPSDWHAYVKEMLASYDPAMRTATMDAERHGPMRHATLVAGISLAPDSWDNTGTKDTVLDLGFSSAPSITAFPIAFSAPSPEHPCDDCGWQMNSNAQPTLTQGSGRSKKAGPLALPPVPAVAEVAAGSSSAAGFFGSKTMMMNVVSSLVDKLDKPALVKASVKTAIRACLPFGFQNASSPILTDAATELPAPSYRYIDGGYTDNTALGWTLAQMQQDCAAAGSTLDCHQGLSAMLLSDGEPGLSHKTLSGIFANANNRPNTAVEIASMPISGTMASSRLFVDAFPDESEWLAYSDYVSTKSPDHHYVSKYWKGVVTTTDNPFFNLKAGDKVELTIFAAVPPRADLIIAPGRGAGALFRNVYGPVAEQQAVDGQRVMEQMLGRSPSPSSPPPSSPPSPDVPSCTVEPWGDCAAVGQTCCPLNDGNQYNPNNGPFKCVRKSNYYAQCLPA